MTFGGNLRYDCIQMLPQYGHPLHTITEGGLLRPYLVSVVMSLAIYSARVVSVCRVFKKQAPRALCGQGVCLKNRTDSANNHPHPSTDHHHQYLPATYLVFLAFSNVTLGKHFDYSVTKL